MMSNLALVIVALLTLGNGRFAPHLTERVPSADIGAQRLESDIESAAIVSRIPRAILTAHWYYESTLNHRALNNSTGAYGIGQLMPGFVWHRRWLKDCARDPYACNAKSAEHAAMALRHYIDRCGTMLRALTAYRVGHCQEPGPRAKATVRLANMVTYRLQHPSRARLIAPRLP
jgi:hypothetical protein